MVFFGAVENIFISENGFGSAIRHPKFLGLGAQCFCRIN